MTQIARVVVPGLPHHVTQRGNRRERIFFEDGRFGSVALDEDHLMNAARYIALNPVRAGLAPRAEDWPHSSVRASHRSRRRARQGQAAPRRAPRFADLLEGEPDAAAFALIRRSELIGRPLGSAAFVAAIERSLGRALAPGKRGRKPRQEGAPGENIKGKDGRVTVSRGKSWRKY